MSRTIKKTIIRKIKKKLVIPNEKQRMKTKIKVKKQIEAESSNKENEMRGNTE